MELQIGNINKLIVKKETDIAYTLYPIGDKETEIFCHFNETLHPLKAGEAHNFFLYFDSKKRLCATMHNPIVTTTMFNFAEVVEVKENIGVFLNIGIAKDILLSIDDLPRTTNGWPKIGEKLPIILKAKKNTLVAKIISREEITNEPKKLAIKDKPAATVISFSPSGLTAITADYDFIFIHKSLTRNRYHIGQIINPQIVNINEHGEYNGSLIEQKEKMIVSDSATLLNYLNNLGGIIPLGNASTPEEIEKLFHMSKSAFKRAVGALYKERLIEISDHKITLIKREPGL